MTCAFAVRGALKKISGVDSVEVSLNKGLAVVKLRPGNKARPEDFWKAVHDNGFTPKQTRVVVRGKFEQASGPELKVSGTGEVFQAGGDTKLMTGHAGQVVVVEGSLVPAKDLGRPVPIRIEAVREVEQSNATKQ